MLTDEQILESWNKKNKQLGLPPIVKLLPSKAYDQPEGEAPKATETDRDSHQG
jgi:hypothetical protein